MNAIVQLRISHETHPGPAVLRHFAMTYYEYSLCDLL